MAEGDRRQDPAHAATLPGLGHAATHATGAPPETSDAPRVGQLATLPAPDVPHAATLPGPHTEADLPALQRVADHSYAIGDEIARGGMGKVLSARDRRLRRDVVIKVTRREQGPVDPRFEREAMITARLQHPSIVRVYDAGILGDGRAFYAMERVRGRSLEVIIDETTTLRERLSLLPHAIAVAEALAYAHSEGVIHRDLKPSNVLIGPFGETVVIDWGLAKDLRAAEVAGGEPTEPSDPSGTSSSSDGSLTQVGSVLGTPSYMAPEQARGDASDERSDIYALGALLYTLLAGVPPVRGRTTEEVLDAVASGRRVPLAEREPAVPPELASIAERALAHDPGDRYASAKELADELRRFAAGKLVASHSYSVWRLFTRWVRRHAITVGVAVFAAIVLAIVGALSIRRIVEERELARGAQREAEHQRNVANRRTDELILDHARGVLGADPSRAAAWLAQLSPAALGWEDTHALAVEASRRGLAIELRGHTADVELVAVDRRGALIATGSDDATVRLWPLDGRAPAVLRGHTGPIESIELSPDGSVLASAGTDGDIWLWDTATAVGRKLSGHRDTVRDVAFSADGTRLASASEDGSLWVWDVASATGAQLHQHTHGLRPVVWAGHQIVVGGFDGKLGMFDPATHTGAMVPAHAAEVRCLALSPDGTKLAAGDENGVVMLWSIDGTRLGTLGRHTDLVRGLAFTPDGRFLISGGGDPIVRVYPIASGGPPSELTGNTDGIKDLAVSADGAYVATAGIDGTARVWSITGREAHVFRGHGTAVKAVAFAPGNRLISTAEDDRARIWRLDPDPAPPPTGPALRAWLAARTNVEVRAPRAPR